MGEENSTEQQKSKPIEVEEQILKFWDDNQIFKKSLDKNRGNKRYVFFDGPPFATGLPHYGSLLASIIKDAIPRYQTMKGHYVRRRWGWDCHGLPIEQLVEQKLGISGKKQIEDLGIEKFNNVCRENVLMYVKEWGKTVHRIGRFVEFENSYKTMDPTYMESVWWTLKQIWEKNLIYEGRKVLLYCPRCETPLSNFEVAADNSYGNVTEDSVYVRAKLKDFKHEHNAYILFWTTTPWTLPGNVGMAVGPDIDYVEVKPRPDDPAISNFPDKDAHYILAKNKAEILFNNSEIIDQFKGTALVGRSYEPIFDMPQLQNESSHKIYEGDFVTTEDGTGIVHTAVVYGEDDYNLGLKVGLPVVPMISPNGLFNDVAPDFLKGKFYKDTEPQIIEELQKENKLFQKEAYTHSVAFCWRCGTRLFYNAIPSWFINIQKIKPRLLELNREQINWYPDYLKEGRFGKGLENAPDWNISRNRYWATALPFWKCDNKECANSVCIGSLEELQEKAKNYDKVYSSRRIEDVDLHRPYIDQIVLECPDCKSEMHRVPEVIDCWVESASMPWAEFHYPFENEQEFKGFFPADFVAEYINQTRTWFYVMLVASGILFDRAPFKNVLNTGIVLAEDGQKMSKSKKNYPDPEILFEKYGADALRYYMLSSPVMLAENLNFSEKEVDEVYKKLVLMLHNVLSFLRMYDHDKYPQEEVPVVENILDRWILALLHELQHTVTTNLDAYNTVQAGRPAIKFINDLSTWYVRRSRDRMKTGGSEARSALRVLAYVLAELSKLLAPFTPFIADYIFKDITGLESVHLADWNEEAGSKPLSDGEKLLLVQMQAARDIVELGLAARKEANVKVRQPLAYLAYSAKIETPQLAPELEKIIAEELNVKEIQFTPELAELPDTKFKENAEFKALLSIKMTPELKEEGLAREIERQVQDLRKKFGFKVGELINVYYNTTDEQLEAAFINKFDRKKTFTMQVLKELEVETDYEAQVEIEGKAMWIGITKV